MNIKSQTKLLQEINFTLAKIILCVIMENVIKMAIERVKLMIYNDLNKTELASKMQETIKEYEKIKKMNLNLDISRGKPCKEQLDLSMELLNVNISGIGENGADYRNYGLVDGIPEAKKLFAELLSVETNEVFVAGNSSLNLMYDLILKFMIFGTGEGYSPWSKRDKLKFICPCPGYDRHFAITEKLGIEMITVKMTENGPDMDAVEALVEDEGVVGIWCVPMYSNPQGVTYSDEVVKRFASLKPKCRDFKIFWDNAYFLHHLTDEHDHLLNIIEECKKAGNPNMVYEFASTSKISFPGAGVAVMVSSAKNINYLKGLIGIQTIGYDKLNQLRHTEYFKTSNDVYEHMEKHKAIMYPKFKIIEDAFDNGLFRDGLIDYMKPNGGYFISVDTMACSAKRVIEIMKELGVVLTPAGSTYPYHNDPDDTNIRIAPTFIDSDSISVFTDVFDVPVRLATLEKLL